MPQTLITLGLLCTPIKWPLIRVSFFSGVETGNMYSRMLPQMAATEGCLFVFQRNGGIVNRIDFVSREAHTALLPSECLIQNCLPVDRDSLLIETQGGERNDTIKSGR